MCHYGFTKSRNAREVRSTQNERELGKHQSNRKKDCGWQCESHIKKIAVWQAKVIEKKIAVWQAKVIEKKIAVLDTKGASWDKRLRKYKEKLFLPARQRKRKEVRKIDLRRDAE